MKEQHNIKYQLIFMWLYIFAVYLPFYLFMIIRHDVFVLSLSGIGWAADGLHYLALYLFLTLPFCLYQLFFLNRHFTGNHQWIYIASVTSCILMTIGGFIPLRPPELYRGMYLAHMFTSIGATIAFMVIILVTLVLHALKCKYKKTLLLLYGIFFITLLAIFIRLQTEVIVAMFQLSVTLSLLLILLVVNTVSAKSRQFKMV